MENQIAMLCALLSQAAAHRADYFDPIARIEELFGVELDPQALALRLDCEFPGRYSFTAQEAISLLRLPLRAVAAR